MQGLRVEEVEEDAMGLLLDVVELAAVGLAPLNKSAERAVRRTSCDEQTY